MDSSSGRDSGGERIGIGAAAAILRCPAEAVRRYVSEGRLEAEETSGGYSFELDDVEAVLGVPLDPGRPSRRHREQVHPGVVGRGLDLAERCGEGRVTRHDPLDLRDRRLDLRCPLPDLLERVDLRDEGLNPDGSVVDTEGGLWNAQWGAGRVARYHPDGRFDRAIPVGGLHASCPAFGGADLDRLIVTTAREGLSDPDDQQGIVYVVEPGARGQAEHRVIV